MTYTILKFAISAAVLVAVSEISKRSSFIGGLIAALPLTSLLAMMWLWRDTHDNGKIAALSTSIFWFALPSLVLFITFPLLVKRGITFWPSLGISVTAMLASYGAMLLELTRFGIKL
jgi:uncharacterized membrane protein YkvI